MTLNPAAEIIWLDTAGKILAYSAPDSAVKRSIIALEPVIKFIATNATFNNMTDTIARNKVTGNTNVKLIVPTLCPR